MRRRPPTPAPTAAALAVRLTFGLTLGLTFGLTATLAAACGHSPTATPPALAGRFVARTLGDRPLPARTDSSAAEFGVLVADTLELDGRGAGRRAFALRRVRPADGTDTVYRMQFPTAYRVGAGGRLEVGRLTPCPPNALCAANDTGQVLFGGAALRLYRYSQGPALVLERVAP